MFLQDEKDYKSVVSGLRRELKALGVATPLSHNQLLEALAKSLGHTSYAALRAAQPAAPTAAAAPSPVESVLQPRPRYTYYAEPAFLARIAKYKNYRLFNTRGALDLHRHDEHEAPLTLVHGLTFNLIAGTLDDIMHCKAQAYGAIRNTDGELDPQYSGSTDVNWDGQTVRTDSRGVPLWLDEDSEVIPADSLVLVHEIEEDGIPVLRTPGLVVRTVLVDACKRWLVDNRLVQIALAELNADLTARLRDPDLTEAEHASAIGKPDTDGVSAIGQAQWVVGFAMHDGELDALREALL